MKENGKKTIGVIMLLSVALIFGFSFSIQSIASSLISPFYLVACRFLFAGIILSPVFLFKDDYDKKILLKAGILDGLILYSSSLIQQVAIGHTQAGKTGFITTLYIVLVPVFAYIFFKRPITFKTLMSLIGALLGLYLLCGLSLNDLQINRYDLYIIVTAVLFALQIILLEYYSNNTNPLKLSVLAYLVCGILSLLTAIIFERFDINSFYSSIGIILFLGAITTALGFTLQVIGQKLIPATPAALLMSLESVFSAIGAYLILHQTLSPKEMIGCAIMFISAVICQLPERK